MRLDKQGVQAVVASLQLIAANADDQIAAFPTYVEAAEEIALTFHDAMLLLEQDAADEELVPGWWLDALREMNQTLDTMSGPGAEAFWTGVGLRTDLRWQRLRSGARKLLQTVGIALVRPSTDSFSMKFAPADPDQ